MPDTSSLEGQIDATLDYIARMMGGEEEPDPRLIKHICERLLLICGGDVELAMAVLCRQFALERGNRDSAVKALKAVEHQIRERPELAVMLTGPLDVQTNGQVQQIVYTDGVGQRSGHVRPSPLLDPGEQQLVELLQYCLISSITGHYLGPAPATPPVRSEEFEVISVHDDVFPGLSEVVLDGGPGSRPVARTTPDIAGAIAEEIAAANTVLVRVEGGKVTGMSERTAAATPEYMEMVEPDGPRLGELVLPPWLQRENGRDVHRIILGDPRYVMMIGPTGAGKTETARRIAREVRILSDRPTALFLLSTSYIGSHFYTQTPRRTREALDRAVWFKKQGGNSIVLLDEVDQLLGDSPGFESAADRRERLTCQELIRKDNLPGVAIYATLNRREGSPMSAAITSRFITREYPRPTRSQIERIAAACATDGLVKEVGLTAGEFGAAVADYVFSDAFVVATIHYRSGKEVPLRARELQCCSPRKVTELVHDVCADLGYGDVEGEGVMESLRTRVEREFRAYMQHVSAANLSEMTYLPKPVRDSVAGLAFTGPSAAGTAAPAMRSTA